MNSSDVVPVGVGAHRRKRAAVVLVAVLAAITGGCHHLPTTAERDASYAPYTAVRVEDPWAGRAIELRAYLMLRSAGLLRAGTDRFEHGLAAAIDRRGYYLTAAHCVDGDRVSLAVFHRLPGTAAAGEPEMVPEEARVVWRGDERKGEPDLALLYDPRPPEAVFEWAPAVAGEQVVVAAGVNYETPKRTLDLGGGLAGKILRTETRNAPGFSWLLVVENLPLHPGDSGGALATTDGRLVGINYAYYPAGRPRPGFRPAFAARPDLGWLRGLIDEDYARRPHRQRIESFWRRTSPAGFLAVLIFERLRELEAARLAAGAPDDNRAAYNRQELLTQLLADEAGIADGFAQSLVQGALPRIVPSEPAAPADLERVANVLRAQLQMN